MDPKRELAESLPLCLGNEDYLKDFQPLSSEYIFFSFILINKQVVDGVFKIHCYVLEDSGDPNNPMIKEPIKTEEAAKIKVVHFGLL